MVEGQGDATWLPRLPSPASIRSRRAFGRMRRRLVPDLGAAWRPCVPPARVLAYNCTKFSRCALPRATQGGVAERARNVRNFQAPESKFQISECMQVMRACTSYDKCSLKFQAPAEISGAHR